jgi:hypothetical protein
MTMTTRCSILDCGHGGELHVAASAATSVPASTPPPSSLGAEASSIGDTGVDPLHAPVRRAEAAKTARRVLLSIHRNYHAPLEVVAGARPIDACCNPTMARRSFAFAPFALAALAALAAFAALGACIASSACTVKATPPAEDDPACRAQAHCPNDAAPTGDQVDACEHALASPCGPAYRAYLDCAAKNATCDVSGRTDPASVDVPCADAA